MYPATPQPSCHLSDSNNEAPCGGGGGGRAQPLPLHKVWKGSNVFLFGGRLIFGPDVKSLFLTLFLILSPVLFFFISVAPNLLQAFPHHHLGHRILALCGILTANTIILLLVTSGRDPGIIPRNTHPPEPDDEWDTSSISTDWAGSQNGGFSIPLTKNMMVNGIIVKVKYCRTCMLYRPPRCSHCSICNNCVDRFDHHCPWVGQCIGRRNYRFFYMFISSTTLLCLYVHTLCWVNVTKIAESNNCDIWKAFQMSPASAMLISYTFVVAWFVGGLSTFHLYLVCTNQTTYENFRYRYDRKNNPYNLGCVRNLMEVFMSKIPASRFNFREKVKVESCSSDSYSSSYMNRTMSPEIMRTSINHFERHVDIEDIKMRIASGSGNRLDNRSISRPTTKTNDHSAAPPPPPPPPPPPSPPPPPGQHILDIKLGNDEEESVRNKEKSNDG